MDEASRLLGKIHSSLYPAAKGEQPGFALPALGVLNPFAAVVESWMAHLICSSLGAQTQHKTLQHKKVQPSSLGRTSMEAKEVCKVGWQKVASPQRAQPCSAVPSLPAWSLSGGTRCSVLPCCRMRRSCSRCCRSKLSSNSSLCSTSISSSSNHSSSSLLHPCNHSRMANKALRHLSLG